MLRFPKETIVSILAGKLAESECRVVIRIEEKAADIGSLKALYRDRIVGFEIRADLLNDPEKFTELQGMRVRIRFSDQDLPQIAARLGFFHRFRATFTIIPDGSLLKRINFLSGFDFSVHIDPLSKVRPEESGELENALEFFLRNPLLKTPIEPFSTLLRTESQGIGSTLWDTEQEKLDLNFYLDDEETVSLSSRWNKEGLRFGSLNDSWEDLLNSELHRALASFKKNLFVERNPCIYCSHFNLCAGFFRAVEPEWPCEPWQKAFTIICREVHNVKELLKGYGNGKSRN